MRIKLSRQKPTHPPRAKFDVWDEPDDFVTALDLHMRRHGETAETWWRAIIKAGEDFQPSTIAGCGRFLICAPQLDAR